MFEYQYLCRTCVVFDTVYIGYANLAIPKIYDMWYYHMLQLWKMERSYFFMRNEVLLYFSWMHNWQVCYTFYEIVEFDQ